VPAAAGALERLLRDRAEANAVTAATEELAAHLDPFVAALRAALASTAPEPSALSPAAAPSSPSQSRDAASQLTRLLSEFDPGAADFIETHHASLRPLFEDGSWREFEQLVQGYSFGDAQARLEEALENFSAA